MLLKELKNLIDQAVEYAGDCDAEVEVYCGETRFEIEKVGQFGVVPDVVINLIDTRLPDDSDKLSEYQARMQADGRCVQCINPWYDGLCECGKSGPEQEEIANWYILTRREQ